MKNKKRKAIIIIAWIIIWEILSIIVGSKLLLPSPISSVKALALLVSSSTFYFDVGATILRCILGIILSFSYGIIFSALAYRYNTIKDILELPITILKSTPVMAIIIYAIILLTSNMVPILVCFLMCFPISYTNILEELTNIPLDYKNLSSIYKFSKAQEIKYIFFPSLIPTIKSTLKLLAGLSWKSIVAAEVLSIPTHSMGYNLLSSKYYFETDMLFAWIISIVTLSVIFEKILIGIINKISINNNANIKINKKAVVQPLHSPNIVINNLEKKYKNKIVFSNLNIKYKKNTVTLISAPSGKGKTTLFNLISNLEEHTKGKIESDEKINVAYQFQDDVLLPWLTIYNNIALPLSNIFSSEDIESKIKIILKEFDLIEDINKYPHQLSGGMKRRISLARALLFPSNVLLLDEPLKGLDEDLITNIVPILPKYFNNKTVLISTHNKEDFNQIEYTLSTL